MAQSLMRNSEIRDSLAKAPSVGTSYLSIYEAVKSKKGLIAGRLHHHGESCAIGSFFDAHPQVPLKTSVIDEVALVNDSCKGTEKQRRAFVLRWLRWKLNEIGMPGFASAKAPEKAGR